VVLFVCRESGYICQEIIVELFHFKPKSKLNTTSMPRKLTKLVTFITFISLVVVIFIGCRKLDKQIEQLPQNQSEEKFFTTPENISDELKAVVDDIKKQNDQYHFINSFTAKNGLPVWDKVVSNVSITNSQIKASGNTSLIESNPADTLLFFIPLRHTDSSVKAYVACAKFGNQYRYDVYKRDVLTNLYSSDSTVRNFRSAMLSVFGLFEKSINHKDTIVVGGQYQFAIDSARISFGNNSSKINGTNNSNFVEDVNWVTYCFGIGTIQQNTTINPNGFTNQIDREPTYVCFDYPVYTSPTSGSGSGSNSVIGGGNSGGGGSTGGGTPPPNYQCPPAEWWCESGEYRFVNGTLYTSADYPGKDKGFPWAWWETGNYANANLSLIFFNVENLDLNLSQAVYLINNSQVSTELSDFLVSSENSDEAKIAAKITIDVANAGILNNSTSSLHYEIAKNYLPPCCPTGPIMTTQYLGYIAGQMAVLKHEGRCNYYVTCYAMAVKEVVQTGLDVLGLIPVFGEVADVANGVIYTISGDLTNAGLSYAGAIPFVGWAATGTKWARKAITLTSGGKTALNWYKTASGAISFGIKTSYTSKQFRKLLGLLPGDPRQAHHLIPWEVCDDVTQTVIQKAASAKFPFHVQDILNGIPLTTAQHLGSHPQYTQRVKNALLEIETRVGANLTPEIAYQEIVNLTNRIKSIIIANPNLNIDNIIF
jgi:uncharacterized membrane protein YgcG